MSKGIVVDHKELGVRYAISEHNLNDQVEYVRDLKPGESVRTFTSKPIAQAILDERAEEEARAERQAQREALAAERAGLPTEEQIAREERVQKLMDDFKLEELRELAKDEGASSTSGTKRELAERLDDIYVEAELAEANQTGGTSTEATDGNQ